MDENVIEDELPYQLRWADNENGVRCVVVDDLIEWLLSIIDDNGHEITPDQAKLIQVITHQLELIKAK
jgi:hypothetical protein